MSREVREQICDDNRKAASIAEAKLSAEQVVRQASVIPWPWLRSPSEVFFWQSRKYIGEIIANLGDA